MNKLTPVIYVSRAPFISGAERCLQIIIENAHTINVKPILVTGPNSPMAAWAKTQHIKHYSVEMHPLTTKSSVHWLFHQIHFLFVVIKTRARVIHCNQAWAVPITAMAKRILGLKIITHFRDPVTSGTRWWLKSKVDVGISISRYIELQCIEHVEDLVGKKHQFIDPVKIPTNVSKKKTRDDNMPLRMGYIGQIAPVKGLLELLESLAKSNNKDWHLVIAGKDPSNTQTYINKCKALITSLGINEKIEFLGFLENVSDFYNQIDVVLVPSLEEPLGLIPLEAAMHKVPSIVSNVGGLPETIENNVTGWVANDHNEIGELITRLMFIDYTDAGRKASKKTKIKANIETHMKNLIKIYSI